MTVNIINLILAGVSLALITISLWRARYNIKYRPEIQDRVVYRMQVALFLLLNFSFAIIMIVFAFAVLRYVNDIYYFNTSLSVLSILLHTSIAGYAVIKYMIYTYSGLKYLDKFDFLINKVR